ncbi:MalY/PatB family protein [Nocardioides sp. T2.26MG-1]|uniref:MalY/PatB family protein n=1 Tax=Nocardioides sp. T2.26MG-1 TaxID=3041166 RepID=UPI0024779EDA|nr:aminotransferase class I/II-fold pyridoxal phosphate-dependent enzyme [Nocardioides sp. T2.26MG-1]CAI9405955.1 Putative cystathionine beta-lyase [Nocardioides sp. T2.26MG-1]
MIRDLTDEQARAAFPLKWGAVAPGVVPGWVAEMDYRTAEPVEEALVAAVRRGALGYAPFGDGGLGEAFAGFAERHWSWSPPADAVLPTSGVMTGVRLALDALCPPGPVVVPLPCYPPFRDAVAIAGRELVPVTLDPDAAEAVLDLAAVEAAFAAGARTFLLCNPHNPLGRAWSHDELAALASLARRYDVRVVADEIHGPLVLPGAVFTPYLAVDETAVVVTSASKSFNIPAVHGAQLVLLDPADRAVVAGLPIPAQHDWSSLGIVAGVAAWRDCDDWHAALVDRLAAQRSLLGELLGRYLPAARMRPLEATYLAWLDLRAYTVDDPAAAGLEHGVRLAPGADYQPGLPGHVRLNLATSPNRLEDMVHRLATALTPADS